MNIDKIKKYVDLIANAVKSIEELDSSATIQRNFTRSVQIDVHSCGVQSVYMILKYFKRKCTLRRVETQLKTDREGTSVHAIKRVLRSYGLKYRVIADASISDLRRAIDAACPVLISTFDGEHWAVVYAYSPTHVCVCDPSLRKNLWCRISNSRFKEQLDRWIMVVRE